MIRSRGQRTFSVEHQINILGFEVRRVFVAALQSATVM